MIDQFLKKMNARGAQVLLTIKPDPVHGRLLTLMVTLPGEDKDWHCSAKVEPDDNLDMFLPPMVSALERELG